MYRPFGTKTPKVGIRVGAAKGRRGPAGGGVWRTSRVIAQKQRRERVAPWARCRRARGDVGVYLPSCLTIS
jgi:hypothetical protein